MIDRIFCGVLFLLVFIEGGLIIHQELRIERYEQRQALIYAQITELQKKARLTAQDLNFLEKLVLEGEIKK